MTMGYVRSGLVGAFSLLISACGGGGGGSSDTPPRPSASADQTSVSVAKTVAESAPNPVTVHVTVSNVPSAGLYAGISFAGDAVASATWSTTTGSQADVAIQLPTPGDLAVGTHTGNVKFDVCEDTTCTRPIVGSPITINVQYTVTAIPPIVVSALPANVNITGFETDSGVSATILTLNLQSTPTNLPYLAVGPLPSLISYVSPFFDTKAQAELIIQPAAPNAFAIGIHNDTLTVDFCYTPSCVNKLTTAPVQIPVTYTVIRTGAQTEPNVAALNPTQVHGLTHDVVDAKYSKALDAVIMVSSIPANALYVFDTNSGAEKSIALNKPALALSVSPDGLKAAVGHDAMISYIDLTKVGQPGPSPSTELHVSAKVLDLALDSNGYIHVIPTTTFPTGAIRSVAVATNTETIGSTIFYSGARVQLHPSGNFLYAADFGIANLYKFDVTTPPPVLLYGTTPSYSHCGNLWFNETGTNIFTACGAVFQTSTIQANDMLYSGSLQLSGYSYWTYTIRHLSESDARSEIATVQYDSNNCDYVPNQCFTHLALYESNYFNQLAVYSFAPMTVDGSAYGQRGMFVFYSADGSHKFTISKLYGMTDVSKQYYISEL